MHYHYIGDDINWRLQAKHLDTLKERNLSLGSETWTPGDPDILERLDQLPSGPLTLIASRLGAIPAAHWTAENPSKVRRLILLHPSLHLNFPYQGPPKIHFIPTLLVCHQRETQPSYEEIVTLAGKLFADYSLHLTTEPAELADTLTLLTL